MKTPWITLFAIGLALGLGDTLVAQRGAGCGPCGAAPRGGVRAGHAGRAETAEPAPSAGVRVRARSRGGQGAGNGPAARGGGTRCQGTCATGIASGTASAAYVQQLQDALAGELFAHDFYSRAAEVTALPRFSNLARAEQRHAAALRAAIAALGAEPVAAHGREFAAPTDLADAKRQGAALERETILRFDALLADCPDPTLQRVLEQIQQANRRHLRATGG